MIIQGMQLKSVFVGIIKFEILFKKFVKLLTSKRAIIGGFALLDASQLLSKFKGNFVLKCGRFGTVKA